MRLCQLWSVISEEIYDSHFGLIWYMIDWYDRDFDLNEFLRYIAEVVNVLLLWRDTMIKVTYKRKHLIGGLQCQRMSPWPSCQRAWQQAGRHGTRAVVESLYLIHKQKAERERLDLELGFWNLRATSSDTTLSTRPHHLIPPKTVVPTRKQTSKHKSPWGLVSFRLPQ